MKLIGSSLFAAAILLMSAPLYASTLTFLHNFNGADGRSPQPLLKRGDTLYGAAAGGGPYNAGVVFSLDQNTGSEHVLCHFGDGTYTYPAPHGRLVDSNGFLYGTTLYGGTYSRGTIFSVDTTTGTLTTIHNFHALDGIYPSGGLLEVTPKAFYGTTQFDGYYPDAGPGTIFKFEPETGGVKTVHYFAMQEGINPSAGLTEYRGNLFGTTSEGGQYGVGTIFEFEPSTGALTVLHSFADGAPNGGTLVAYKNALYGTSEYGAAPYFGFIYKLDLATNAYRVVHKFLSRDDGANPEAGLTVFNGLLYGVTGNGGRHNNGVLYTLDPATEIETVLYKFSGLDGVQPKTELFASPQALYGTTADTAFKFVP